MNEQDGVQDYYELEALAEAGMFKEALEKHLWFHEASRKFPGMGGVRISYALETWLELAEKYRPAMDALVDLRNNNKETLLKGDGTFDNFHDFSAINQTLGDSEDTYDVFVKIHNDYPKQAKCYYQVVEELIVERKAYDICAAYIADPMDKYSQIQHMHEMNLELIRKEKNMDSEDFISYTRESYISGVCQLIEIMSALGRNEIAEQIQTKALEYFDHDAIKNAKCS